MTWLRSAGLPESLWYFPGLLPPITPQTCVTRDFQQTSPIPLGIGRCVLAATDLLEGISCFWGGCGTGWRRG